MRRRVKLPWPAYNSEPVDGTTALPHARVRTFILRIMVRGRAERDRWGLGHTKRMPRIGVELQYRTVHGGHIVGRTGTTRDRAAKSKPLCTSHGRATLRARRTHGLVGSLPIGRNGQDTQGGADSAGVYGSGPVERPFTVSAIGAGVYLSRTRVVGR